MNVLAYTAKIYLIQFTKGNKGDRDPPQKPPDWSPSLSPAPKQPNNAYPEFRTRIFRNIHQQI
ncbi:MAG: hypothetical protein EAZ60_04565 [Oscillatoriales cyanobacterium]|nr:MAG: hypothetical protein EAZ60_04565 [Oscillatoriales cyanobacterium]